jgi:hypothetical protein
MARTKAELGPGARLSDYLSASLLARVYPPQLVHQVLDEHGVNSRRVRSFPAVATTYYSEVPPRLAAKNPHFLRLSPMKTAYNRSFFRFHL